MKSVLTRLKCIIPIFFVDIFFKMVYHNVIMKPFILTLGTALSFSSCTLFDQQFKEDYTVCTAGATVAASIRQDPNKPQRLDAYKKVQIILDEYIASGATDSETFRSKLTIELQKIFSASLTKGIVDSVMQKIEESMAKHPDDALKALRLANASISCGIELAESSQK